jgi:transposase
MRRQNWTKEEQRLMVLEILKGAKTVNQVAKEHGVSDSLVYRWRDQALQGISEAFDNKKRNNQANFNAERDCLLKIIGEQACVIDTLKKTSEMLSR